jgi:hypothetical protein
LIFLEESKAAMSALQASMVTRPQAPSPTRQLSVSVPIRPVATGEKEALAVDGLWVHQGSAEPGANWERILEDVREERIDSVLQG